MFYNKTKFKTKIALIIASFSIITLLILGNGILYNFGPITTDRNVNEKNPKTSDYWTLVGTTIDINGNWATVNASNDWCNGAGTIADPYIIENVTVDAQNSGSCISIQNSVDYFIIRNCTLIDGGSTSLDSGIYLNNVQNGLIENNTCYDSRCGIVVQASSDIIVKENIIYSSSLVGIYMYDSTYSDAIKNKITGTTLGLSAYSASNINFSQNTLENTGINVRFNDETQLGTFSIDTSNTVSGKSVYFYLNENNLDDSNFTDPGQIILVGCDDCSISGFDISFTNIGLQLLFCDNAIIDRNTFYTTNTGIAIHGGNFNNLSNNFHEVNEDAFSLYESLNNTIQNNTVLNSYNGIFLYLGSANNTVIGNNFTQCTLGIQVSTCEDNYITGNDVIDSTSHGIYSYNSAANNHFTSNNIDGSGNYGVILGNNVDSTTFQSNIIKNSGTAGVYISTSDCESNLFFQNSFSQNTKHVIDDGTNNNYNNSLIGNYWDNYTGGDANDDGIGDSPHLVQTANSIYDYLPIWNDGFDIPIPIHVDNNWTETVAAFDWVTGSGTWGDPYLIEDITINGQDKKSGIFIENTNEHFIIRNCTIHNTPVEFNSEEGLYDAGIVIKQADNGIIYNNTIYDNGYGAINLQYADNHTIFDNHLYQNTIVFDQYLWGIYNFWCSFNRIYNNTISANAGVVAFIYCENMTLRNNIMERAGFLFRTSSLQQANTHYIPTSNFIDGKTLYYYKNQGYLSSADFQNPWQIILANCHNSSITDIEFDNPKAYRSISLHYSDDILIQNCNFTDVSTANDYIHLDGCNNNTIQYNRFYNEDSVYLEDSSYNTIKQNEFINADLCVLLYDHSDYNKIYDNEFEGGEYGVFISYYSSNNEIYKNNISDMSVDGIRIWRYNTFNQIYQNNITNCNDNGIDLENDCQSNTIQLNKIISNTIGVHIKTGCTLNSIFNNIFEFNGLHAQDDGTGNLWNNLTIGNYWDNYTGSDLDDDLIGDSPHPIAGTASSFDAFPIWDDGDSLAPSILINSPAVDSYHSTPPTIQVTITDPSGVNETWYTIIGSGESHYFTGNSFEVNMTSWMNQVDGNIIISIYANDSVDNLAFVNITLNKDSHNPQIFINNPIGGSEFGEVAPYFNLTISELNISHLWFTINDSTTLHFVSVVSGFNIFQMDSIIWEAIPDGYVLVSFYTNDTAGNVATISVTIIKDTSSTSPPSPPVIPGYDLSLILIVTSLLSFRLILKRKKLFK